MPCDESPVYIGSSKPTDSPRITSGSRRSLNKIGSSISSGINSNSSSRSSGNSSSNSSSSNSSKSTNHPLPSQEAVAAGSPRNHYGTVAMAPRPLHSTTTFSTSCSSTSSSSSGSSTVSSSFSPSSFDRAPPRNGSNDSSSSLILILDRPTGVTETNSGIPVDKYPPQRINDHNFSVAPENAREQTSSTFVVSGKGHATSSLEILAKKKSGRCRRRRSATNPRNVRQHPSKSREDLEERLSTDLTESGTNGSTVVPMDDGFVATSTLTKNRDSGVLSVMKNSSRSAGKVKLQSSASADTLVHTLCGHQDRDLTRATDIGLASYTPTAIKSQQSTISVASIRGTNIAIPDSSNNSNNNNNNNNNSSNNYSRMEGSLATATSRADNAAANFAIKIRCNVPSASAPALHRYHRQIPSLTRAFSHSTTPHSSVPLVPVIHASPSVSSSRLAAKQNEQTTWTSSITTCASTRTSPVKTATSLPAYTVFATGKSASPSTEAVVQASGIFARVDSSASLKSSSFTTSKMLKTNRARTSIHASLGQLPTTSSCRPCVIGTEAASLENVDSLARSTGLESNVDPSSMPIALYSSTSPADATTLSPHTTTRTSLDRVCYSTGASTMSSASSKTPLALPSTVNSVNVATAFKNSLVSSVNNNNNNGRCNHLSGTCTIVCNGTTTNSQTSSTLTRTPNLVNGVASTSSWTNNSTEQETDYVVDPVQGNAYHKGQFLGKGGFARVYLMTDVANGNQYACKIIPKNRMQKIHIQKIAREIMIHKELNHVNVVQMHHYFEDNINVYMLLEPCPRKSLMHVLKYRGKVTEPEARYYMKQMVTGVAYIHSQKVVHRDLKPGNMFLSDGMIVKIGDFGLATRPDGQRRRVTICGTPNYIAPEVLYKQAYSYEADVWALGCILYALLAGQPPFDTATLKETYARICNNRYKKLDDSIVSRSGQDLIRWLLQPIPELRPSLERVKEHAYLTMEYVPAKLAHTCCYRMPPSHAIVAEHGQTAPVQQLGLSGTSAINRVLASTENIDRNKRDIASGTIVQKNLHQITSGTVSQAQLEALKIGGQKKPKVGNWLFRKLPKLPRFRQRLSRFLCPEQKKPDSVMMHRALEACLAEIRCTRAQENPMLVDRIAPLFVTKWIDYSNKYGLGFQLSDRSVGVLFNDSTKMSYTHDRRRVEYATTDDDVTRYRRELDVPSNMEEKLELLRHFTHYMDNFLTNGGEVKEQKPTKLSRTNSANVPRMRRWLRTDKAIVMELTVPLLQVNFFVDHSKIVVSEGIRGRGYLVTYIDGTRQASSYWLNDLRDLGCTAELYERLHYVCKVIGELENEAIFDAASTITIQQHRKPFGT